MKSIVMKLLNTGNFSPIDFDTRRLILLELKPEREYELKIELKRNIKHNAKYWVLLKALEFHFGNTDIGWHLYFKSKFLPMVDFKLPSGKRLLYPNSTAFDKLDQIGFDEY